MAKSTKRSASSPKKSAHEKSSVEPFRSGKVLSSNRKEIPGVRVYRNTAPIQGKVLKFIIRELLHAAYVEAKEAGKTKITTTYLLRAVKKAPEDMPYSTSVFGQNIMMRNAASGGELSEQVQEELAEKKRLAAEKKRRSEANKKRKSVTSPKKSAPKKKRKNTN
jgi:hypothetical protein